MLGSSAHGAKRVDALFLHGRLRTWQVQAQLFWDRVHNTMVMGQRLSVVMASVLLVAFVLILTIEDSNVDTVGNHPANLISQVKGSHANLPVHTTKQEQVVQKTISKQEQVAQKTVSVTATGKPDAKPAVAQQPQEVASQAAAHPFDIMTDPVPPPTTGVPVHPVVQRIPQEDHAAQDQTTQKTDGVVGNGHSQGGLAIHKARHIERNPIKPKGTLPAVVRPADVPEDVPDWALRPAVDMPFFSDEEVRPPPTGSEHVKRCIQMGRPLDVCLEEGTEVAQIEKLYKAIPQGTHAPIQAYALPAESKPALSTQSNLPPPKDQHTSQEVAGLADTLKHKAQQIERMQRVVEDNLCKSYLNTEIAPEKYEMWTHGYSDAGADRAIALEIFKKRRSGVFLDIGTADGNAPSNTWMLEKCLGWHGVCIEPHSVLLKDLTTNRPQCKPVQAVIGAADGPAKMHIVEGHSARYSAVIGDESERHSQLINNELASYGGKASTDQEVVRYKADDLLKKWVELARVDVVSVDVGSGVMPVLDGLHLGQVIVPEVIVIGVELVEADRRKTITKQLEDNRYVLHRTIGNSMVFKRRA